MGRMEFNKQTTLCPLPEFLGSRFQAAAQNNSRPCSKPSLDSTFAWD
jgi:hypothetical protein